jgi:O-antigen/teichoic acid export membrane protein
VPVAAVAKLRQAALQGLHRIELSQVPTLLIWPGLTLALVLGATASGVALRSSGALALNAAAAAVALAIAAIALRRVLPRGYWEAAPADELRPWLRSALPLAAVGTISVAGPQVGPIVLGSIGSAESVGIYQAAAKLAEILALVLAAINTPLAPTVSRLHALGEKQRLQEVTSRAARASLLFSLPLAIAFIATNHWLLQIFGGEFTSGGTVVNILVVGQLVNAAMGPVGIVLIMTGNGRAAVRGFLLGLILDLALTSALVPIIGAEGAAIGRMADLLVWNITLGLATYRILGVNATAFRLPWRG